MTFSSHARLADAVLPAVVQAARVILDARRKGLIIHRKADESPVTDADRLAESILTAALNAIEPDIPVVGEEAVAEGTVPQIAETFFLIDPLDGTRDYAVGQNDFSINIGLVDAGRPVFGLIFAPARKEFFLTTAPGRAQWAELDPAAAPASVDNLARKPLQMRQPEAGNLQALVSRRESGAEFDARLAALGVTRRLAVSSAVKFGLLARGDADIYPRFGPTCEWDTAAGHAIVEAAGGSLTALDGSPLVYGKSATGFVNGPFVARRKAV